MQVRTVLRFMALAASLAAGQQAVAALGAAPIAAEELDARTAASLHVTTMPAYVVRELKNEGGTTIHEFVDRSGKVFAVTWTGRFKPDLNYLLGSFAPRFTTQNAQARSYHRSLVLRDPDLVVESAGHPRAFSGRAYLPQQVPAGLAIDEIK